jgi:high-affinity K+ transport system ATPase subunit B
LVTVLVKVLGQLTLLVAEASTPTAHQEVLTSQVALPLTAITLAVALEEAQADHLAETLAASLSGTKTLSSASKGKNHSKLLMKYGS